MLLLLYFISLITAVARCDAAVSEMSAGSRTQEMFAHKVNLLCSRFLVSYAIKCVVTLNYYCIVVFRTKKNKFFFSCSDDFVKGSHIL